MNDPRERRTHDDRLDDRLRAAFPLPPEQQFAAMARQAAVAPQPRWPWLVAAAAAALLVLVFALTRSPRGPEGHGADELGALWVAAYDHAIDTGFGSGSCCQPGSDLAAHCERAFGIALQLHESEAVSMLGCYCGLSTGGSLCALLQVGGDPVGVFVLPRARDPQPRLPADRDLALTRRELGPLVLYALAHVRPDEALGRFALPAQ
jgi:hypothetical protein